MTSVVNEANKPIDLDEINISTIQLIRTALSGLIIRYTNWKATAKLIIP
jgi:hypothetical protein